MTAADRPSEQPPITCARCGRGMWPGDNACCPLPKTGTHRWGDPTNTTKETS